MSETEAHEGTSAAPPRQPFTVLHGAVERLNIETCEAAEIAFGRGEVAGVRGFLWSPLRVALAAIVRRRLWESVFGAYWQVARAAKLWEAEMRWRERHLEKFEGRGLLGIVRREWRDVLDGLLRDENGATISGGRGGARRLVTNHGTVIVRRYRRGGAMRWLGESHFGFRLRPFRELRILLRARRRGLPVPDPVAAVVERKFGVAYRGRLVTREISDSQPILDFLSGHPGTDVVPLLARRLRELHDAGLWHPDLNLGNILVMTRSYGPSIAFVDLDRARLRDRPLGVAARLRSIRRLRRSATKLDPSGSLLGAPALDRLEGEYWRFASSSGAPEENPGGAG